MYVSEQTAEARRPDATRPIPSKNDSQPNETDGLHHVQEHFPVIPLTEIHSVDIIFQPPATYCVFLKSQSEP
jgi:hypothetical protein